MVKLPCSSETGNFVACKYPNQVVLVKLPKENEKSVLRIVAIWHDGNANNIHVLMHLNSANVQISFDFHSFQAYSCFQTLSISDPTSPLEPSTTSGLLEDRKGDSFNSTSYQPTELLTDPVNSPKSSTSPSLPVYPAQHFEVSWLSFSLSGASGH